MFSELPQIGYDDLKTPISDYFSIKRVMKRPSSSVQYVAQYPDTSV